MGDVMRRRLDTALLVLVFLVCWELVAVLVGQDILTPPLTTLQRAVSLLSTEALWRQAASTGRTLLFACAIVLVGGLATGCLIGSSRLASLVVEPLLAPMYAIPKIALYPIILLIFGLSPLATIVFAALHGIFPVLIFTIGGIRKVRPIYLQTARVLRLTPLRRISSIRLSGGMKSV